MRLYRGLGFGISRELRCFRGPVDAAKIRRGESHVRVIGIADIERDFRPHWGWTPSWQNDCESLRNVEGETCIVGAYDGSRLQGYGALSRADHSVAQLFVAEPFRRQGVGSTILADLAQRGATEALRMANIDDRDEATAGLCESLGWENYVDQYEMVYELGEGG